MLTAPNDVGPSAGGWPTRGHDDGTRHDAWVLPAVRDRLQHGIDGQAADFRPATALFLSFAGIDYDLDREAGAKLDTFVRWVQGVVTSWGGAVVQLTLGDKGAYAYACFGAPLAHDDDAARAVAAAQTLRQPPQAYVENVRIGLAHGQMYTGTYVARRRRTFGVLGPKTNLAARLMVLAPPGGVLCDEGVVAQARRAGSHSRCRSLARTESGRRVVVAGMDVDTLVGADVEPAGRAIADAVVVDADVSMMRVPVTVRVMAARVKVERWWTPVGFRAAGTLLRQGQTAKRKYQDDGQMPKLVRHSMPSLFLLTRPVENSVRLKPGQGWRLGRDAAATR